MDKPAELEAEMNKFPSAGAGEDTLDKSTFEHKLMPAWQCVKNCGACCHLDPSDRPDLATYLSATELQLYLSLVGEDGWCINFDHTSRECRIYDRRPRFCRVTAEVFHEMYGIGPEELNEFAIDCCHQQIMGVYGEKSAEQLRFEQATQ